MVRLSHDLFYELYAHLKDDINKIGLKIRQTCRQLTGALVPGQNQQYSCETSKESCKRNDDTT